MIRLLVLALLAVCAPAFAAVSNVAPAAVRSGASSFVVSAASNGTPIAVASRSVVAGATSGEFLIRDMFTATGPAGSLPLTATRTVSGIGAARAIAAQAAKGFTPVAIGLGAYELMQAYRMRAGSSGLEQDAGVPPGPVVCWAATGWAPHSNNICGMSPVGTAEAVHAKIVAANPGQRDYGCDAATLSYSNGGNTSSIRCYFNPYSSGGYIDYRSYVSNKATQTKCPDIIDALTGQSYTPSTGTDGKCATGRYDPVTEENAATRLAAGMTVKAVTDYINSPVSQAAPIQEVAPLSVTGPATQVGQPVTTTSTGPTGTTTRTVTPTYQYNYAGDTITYNTVNTTVTNVTNNEGVTTTETETKPDNPQKGDCELYPNSVGCLELGDAPDEDVPEQARSVDIQPEGVNLPSGCPADVALPGGRVLSYAAACAAAEDVAPLVIAAGVLSALLIAVAAIRGS